MIWIHFILWYKFIISLSSLCVCVCFAPRICSSMKNGSFSGYIMLLFFPFDQIFTTHIFRVWIINTSFYFSHLVLIFLSLLHSIACILRPESCDFDHLTEYFTNHVIAERSTKSLHWTVLIVSDAHWKIAIANERGREKKRPFNCAFGTDGKPQNRSQFIDKLFVILIFYTLFISATRLHELLKDIICQRKRFFIERIKNSRTNENVYFS